MEQVNAIIRLHIDRLDHPLWPIKARQSHNFVAALHNVPADITAVWLRIYTVNGAFYDVTAHEHASGIWSARIPASCFLSTGEYKYEVHGVAADDEPAALGEGRLVVYPFSISGEPLVVGAVQSVAQLPCEGGGTVQVVMKWDGHEWMPEAIVNNSEVVS